MKSLLVKVLVLLCAAYGVAKYVYSDPRVVAFAFGLLQPTEHCSAMNVATAVGRSVRQAEAQASLKDKWRIVEQTATQQRVSDGTRSFWEPRIDGSAVIAQLAELEGKYSGGTPPIKAGDIVLDCGANVGTYTRYALDRGAKTVVAVEPSPANVESLRLNFATEIASGRVIVYPKGVWDRDDVLVLKQSRETTAMDSIVTGEAGQEGIHVPLTTIDKMVLELGLSRVDFIKMDIEGAERRALEGARGVIAKHRPQMELSVNHLPDDPTALPAIVRRSVPDYRVSCLMCGLTEGRVQPLIFLIR